ncbi:MAG TPA: hypothetical protein GX714_15295 [Chloroflexi bacterium]|jgi:hypothetical protein|nr:hypothetical protein [Chloroflexota bacterium]
MASPRRASRQVWRLRLYALVALLILLAALLTNTVHADLVAGRRARQGGDARTIPDTDVNPYGANFFLTREVEPWKRDKTLHMAADAGIGWVKQHFPWEEVEPRRKGEFIDPISKGSSWAKFDEIVAECEAHGLRIVARLDRPPDWSRQDNSYKERPPDDLNDYGDYVYAFVERYRGRIDHIQIWNEPNIFPEWGNQPVDPEAYVELLKVAYRRAKEANPNVRVLAAPLAITLGEPHPEPGKWRSMSDLDYLEAMYRAGAKDYFDIYSANAFGMDRPPEDPPDANTLNFQRVVLHRRIMEKHGDADKAVWFNEFGWNAAPEHMAAEQLTWSRVDETQQAEYTVRAIEMARSEWPWAGVFMIWYFRQVGNIPPERADYYFRMVDTDFAPRPLYTAVQAAARSEQPPGPGLYQELNPAVQATGSWGLATEAGASAGGLLRSESPGDRLAFSFEGTGIILYAMRSPDGGRLLATVDGKPAPALASGVVDLYSAEAGEIVRLPLARNLSPGVHRLELEVASDHHRDSTGHVCTIDAFEVLAEGHGLSVGPVSVLGVGILLDLWLLLRTWRRARWVIRAP